MSEATAERASTVTEKSAVRELVGAEVLVVDKDASVRQGMIQLLAPAGLHVTAEADPTAAFGQMDRRFFTVAVVDVDTPGPGFGLDTVREVKRRSPTSMVIALTPRKSFEVAVAAVRAGALDVIWKSPESVAHLQARVLAAADRSVGKREVNAILAEVKATYDGILERFVAAERRASEAAEASAPSPRIDEVSVLVVDADTSMAEGLRKHAPPGFVFDSATTGGEALDRCSSTVYHLIAVAAGLPDLPGSIVVRSVHTQSPASIVLQYTALGPQGKAEVVQAKRVVPLLNQLQTPEQLASKLDELAEGVRVKARERRFAQAFRERHYDLLRRYAELKLRIDRTLGGS